MLIVKWPNESRYEKRRLKAISELILVVSLQILVGYFSDFQLQQVYYSNYNTHFLKTVERIALLFFLP